MSLEIIAYTLDIVGKVLLGLTAILVHRKIKSERKIDTRVIHEMELEFVFGVLAIFLMIAGYILHIIK
jgi:hypothetical protein